VRGAANGIGLAWCGGRDSRVTEQRPGIEDWGRRLRPMPGGAWSSVRGKGAGGSGQVSGSNPVRNRKRI
jgi:hypothetical protein